MRRRWAAAPAEGWLSLILVAALAVIVAWSLDDAGLVLGRREWTDFLAWMSLAGGCHPNRDTVAAIEDAFEVERLWRRGLIVQGAARPRA